MRDGHVGGKHLAQRQRGAQAELHQSRIIEWRTWLYHLVAGFVQGLGEDLVIHAEVRGYPRGRGGAGSLPLLIDGVHRGGLVKKFGGGIPVAGRPVPVAGRHGDLVVGDQHLVHLARRQVRRRTGNNGEVGGEVVAVIGIGHAGRGQREVGGHVGGRGIREHPVAGLVAAFHVHGVDIAGFPVGGIQLPPGAVGAQGTVKVHVVPDLRGAGISPVGNGTVPVPAVGVALYAHIDVAYPAGPEVGGRALHLAAGGNIAVGYGIGDGDSGALHFIHESVSGAHVLVVAGPVAAFGVEVVDDVRRPHVVVADRRHVVSIRLRGGVVVAVHRRAVRPGRGVGRHVARRPGGAGEVGSGPPHYLLQYDLEPADLAYGRVVFGGTRDLGQGGAGVKVSVVRGETYEAVRGLVGHGLINVVRESAGIQAYLVIIGLVVGLGDYPVVVAVLPLGVGDIVTPGTGGIPHKSRVHLVIRVEHVIQQVFVPVQGVLIEHLIGTHVADMQLN